MPTLDIDDFIGREFTTGPDGKLYQLPDQQFANLYWFRYDWFDRPDLQGQVQGEIYGYELGVPVNWSAYEDIAEFFSRCTSKEIDGVRVYGHMDYGKRAPDLGWRMTDAWLSMAGAGTQGPAERPCRSTSGASAWRRVPATRSAPPSAAAARRTARPRSTPSASGTNGCASTPLRAPPATTSTSPCRRSRPATWPSRSSGTRPSPPPWSSPSPRATTRSTTKATRLWRMAPSPHGPYWEEGQKLGYQDAGSWTLFKSTPVERRKAAWLYAQFTVSKTVSLKKSHVGLTHRSATATFATRASPSGRPSSAAWSSSTARPTGSSWSPTGINVPDYPKLAQIWWQQIGDVNSGAFTPQEAMDRLGCRDGPGHGPHAVRPTRRPPTSTAAVARA